MAKYYKTKWHQLDRWQCVSCPIDKMSEAEIIEHVKVHNTKNVKASCIMPTRNRRQFLPAAIDAFIAQTYQDKELIIVSDGESIGDLIPRLPQFHHIDLNYRASIGMKRNIACMAATGRYIIHMDDDDVSHPTRIAEQVAALESAAICGIETMWCGSPGDQIIREIPGWKGYLAGLSLAYQRQWWDKFKFEDISLGEDVAFVSNFHQDQMATINKPWLILVGNHPGNTSSRENSPSTWVEYKEN